MIVPYCYITDSTHVHHLNNNQFPLSGGKYKNVIIKRNCWLGSHRIILPGVTVNENSIIAANSIVFKGINKVTLNAGSPAVGERHNTEIE